MKIARAFSLFVVLASAFTVPVVAQSSTEDFVSIAGRFAIKLPGNYADYKTFALSEIGGKKLTGSTYRWNLGQDQATASYGAADIDLEASASAEAYLTAVKDDFVKKTAATVVGERKTSLEGHPGLIFILQSESGRTMYWTYLVRNRLYFLSLSLTDAERLQENVKTISTFRLATAAELDARNAALIDQLTPEPFPAESRDGRPTTDAQDMGLKGKVKFIVVEGEEFSSGAPVGFRGRGFDMTFSEAGDITKVVDYNGVMPESVRVYGYLKGERVYRERRKEKRLVLVGSKEEKNPEPEKIKTELIKVKYKFDNTGRLMEMRVIDESGNEREKFVYGSGKIEHTYNPVAGIPYLDKLGGSNKTKDVDVLDANGFPTETTRTVPDAPETSYTTIGGQLQQISRPRTKTEKYKYQYELDSKGNWIKRTTFSVKDGAETAVRVAYRTITYY